MGLSVAGSSSSNNSIHVYNYVGYNVRDPMATPSCWYSASKECYQIAFLERPLGTQLFFSWISHIFQHTYFYTVKVQPRKSSRATHERPRNTKPHRECWFISLLKGDTNLTKGRSSLTTFWLKLKLELYMRYHVHNRRATESLLAHCHDTFLKLFDICSVIVACRLHPGWVVWVFTVPGQKVFHSGYKVVTTSFYTLVARSWQPCDKVVALMQQVVPL